MRAISTEISRHAGQCLDPEKGAVFVRDGVVGYSGMERQGFSFLLWSENGQVVGLQGHGNLFDGLGVMPVSSDEIPKFLSRAEAATRDLCPNTPNPSPDNDTSPAQLSGSVALRFFEQGGRIIG